MIIRNKRDILNPNYTINEHPDNTELENWLSWLHIAKYNVKSNMINLEYELDQLELELKLLRTNIFLSLDSEDYPTIKAKKSIIENRIDVIELKDKITNKTYEIESLNKINNRYINRDCMVNKLANMRAYTSNFEENIEWTVRQNRRRK
jgi:hypothetical protein